GNRCRDELDADLLEAARRDQPRLADVVHVGPLETKDAGEHGAEKAADAVHAERVKGVVVLEEWLHAYGDIADDTGNEADREAAPGIDEAGRRRDRDQAGDDPRRQAKRRRLAAMPPFGEHP